jgi:multimeric flavodoxin WrbA
MKLLAINGSPRKHKNTDRLLEQVVSGAQSQQAEAELIQLRGLQYTGCISCFECKRIGGPSYGRCAVKDDLRPVLDKAHEADILVQGAPFYFGTETAFMRAFQERLWFQYYLYSTIKPPLSLPKKATALVYTMNINEERIAEFGYDMIINRAKGVMEALFAPCEVLLSCDTLQFDDYSKYDTDMWDVQAKQKRHAEIFPQELKKAYRLGVKLAG